MKRLFTLLILLVAVRAYAQESIPSAYDNAARDERRIKIGNQLFHDPRLSINGTRSCADCHQAQYGFSDGRQVSEGLLLNNGKRAIGSRNSPTLLNGAFQLVKFHDGVSPLGFADQMWRPVQNPREMGQQTVPQVVNRINAITGYRKEFVDTFDRPADKENIAACVEQFQRTLVCRDTNYNRRLHGDSWADIALDTGADIAAQRRGEAVFQAKNCQACHFGEDARDGQFHNLGVDDFTGNRDVGREGVTNNPKDRGKFLTPTLIGLKYTMPYGHNGTFPQIADFMEFLDRGAVHRNRDGQRIVDQNLDPLIRPLGMSAAEKRDLVVYLSDAFNPRDFPKVPEVELPR